MNELDKLLKKYTDGALRSGPLILVLIEMLRMEIRAARRLIDNSKARNEELKHMLLFLVENDSINDSSIEKEVIELLKSK